jgi:Pvc16 N-terminal domain
MSDVLAVAAVTRTFVELLERVLDDDSTLAPFEVTARAPDRALVGDEELTKRRLNLFLYQVTPSAAYGSRDLPFRNGAGAIVSRPVLALDLHYLLTAYGLAHDELDAHRVMAHAMSLVHDNGVLPRDFIRAALAQAAVPLRNAKLADQVEAISLSPEVLTDEELFRMWSVFGAGYRLSVGYMASVVLIERPKRTVKAPPVRHAGLTAAPLRKPIVEEIEPRPLVEGATMVLRGLNLDADVVTLRFATGDEPASNVKPSELKVPLPAGLRAGASTVQVLHEHVLAADPTQTRPWVSSDPVAFVLAPEIETPIPASVARGSDLTLTVSPAIERGQRVQVLLGAVAIGRTLTTGAPDTDTSMVFRIPADFPTGSHLLRIQVDGAESPLQVDDVVGSPTFGQYVGPKLQVTT